MIEISVKKNQARLKPIEPINSGCIGIVGVKFDFSSDWNERKKTAIIFVDKYDEKSAFKKILKDDAISAEDMPKELFAKKADLYIGVFGDNTSGQREITNLVCVNIKEGTPTEGVNLEVTPDLYNQILTALTELEEAADNLQERADNGEFNGKDGTDGKDGYTPVKGKDYFTAADINQIKNDARADVVSEITPTLENNLKSAKDYTDNAIIRDFKDITYDETTATFVFTRHDNTTFTVDLPIEQTVKDGRYDDKTAELVLVLVSGQEIRIPVSGLIDDYTGTESATIQVVISADNKITCNIKGGSISKTLLTTELQAEIDGKANKIEMSNIVQEVGGKLLELATTDKESYVGAINELVTALANKAEKNEWKLYRTYEASGEDGGFLYKLDSLDVDEVRIIGKGLTFSQGCNLNFNFRSKKNTTSSGHMNLVSANCTEVNKTFEIEGFIERIKDNQIKVTLTTTVDATVQTSSVVTRSHIFAANWLSSNIYQVSLGAANSTIINTGTIDVYVRGGFKDET